MEKLLDYFTPEHYKIKLHINKHTKKVFGMVKIMGERVSDGGVKLHAKGFGIRSVAVNGVEVKYRYENDVLEIAEGELKKVLDKGSMGATKGDVDGLLGGDVGEVMEGDVGEKGGGNVGEALEIKVDYTFVLNENMEGAYLSTYRHNGEEKRLVTTQFESHYARECFPCVDEPAAKATFGLEIIVPDIEDTVISNMPVKIERIVEHPAVDENLNLSGIKKKKIVLFEDTPRMSTYLLAFCVGEFKKYTQKNKHGVEVTTYCAMNQSEEMLIFPTQVAGRALDFYDELFGVKYPLQKLEQIAIPDFEAGAMENWGLVTYRESCLLANEFSALDQKEHVALVIAHELSHQWFGNLVTMKWWDDLWLNESFANVMEYFCVDAIFPEYRIWETFFTQDCLAALRRDALPGVQAVKQAVNDPAEIATLFDGAIVYAKGARLMLMLVRLMGEEAFFKGIKEYFAKYAYENTVGDDLWEVLGDYAEFDVKKFMSTWISCAGYPILTKNKGMEGGFSELSSALTTRCEKSKNGQMASENGQVAQKRFLLIGESDKDVVWPIPELKDDMSGHYLINLSDDDFRRAVDNFAELSLEQRLRLLIDRWLLAQTDAVESSSLVELARKFGGETSEPIWNILTLIVGSLDLFVEPESEMEKDYHKFLLTLIAEQRKRLGMHEVRGDSDNDKKLRALILMLGLSAEDEDLAEGLAKDFDGDYSRMDANLRYAILKGRFLYEKERPFAEYLKKYEDAVDPEIKDDLLGVICGAKSEAGVKRLMKLLECPEVVRPQDHLYLLARLLRNYKTKKQAAGWLYENWDYVLKMVGDKSVDDYVKVVGNSVKKETEKREFLRFVKKLEGEQGLARTVAMAKAGIEARMRLIERDFEGVREVLSV